MNDARVLFITTENPFPADGGGRLRARGLVDILARRFTLDLVTYARPENLELTLARSRMNILELPRTVSSRGAIVRGLCRLRGCGYMCHADVDLGATVDSLCRQRSYRMVFVDNTMLGSFIPQIRSLQPEALIVAVAHNFETSLAAQVAQAQTRWLRKVVFTYSARAIRRTEARACRDADLVLVTSEDERRSFAQLAPDHAAKLRVVPSFIDSSAYRAARVDPDEEASIVFPGDMGFFPNVMGALYFYSQIFPIIKRRRPQVRWIVAGRNCQPSLTSAVHGDPAVVITGYVPNVLEYIARSRVVVVPLLHGSGTRLKILEAWALGRPVVSTSKGCEGMACRDGHDILIADTPDAFAECVVRLLDDPGLAEGVARHGFDTLLEHYDSHAIGKRLLADLRA